MSSTIQSGDIQRRETEPVAVCAGCDDPISIGVGRFPTTVGSVHEVCRGLFAAPSGPLGTVGVGDHIEVKIREKWISGTVKQVGRLKEEGYVVQVALEEVVRGGVVDHVGIHTCYLGSDVTGMRWTQPEAFDVIPEWDTNTLSSDGLVLDPSRSVGPVEVRCV